jgi:hypothetical protein
MGADGKCLDDANSSSADGAKIQVWTCNGESSQGWTYAEDDTLRIHGKCLAAGSTSGGAKILLATCTGAVSQRWAVISDAQLANQSTGLCLRDPDVTAKENGVQLEALGCAATNNGTENWALSAGPILSAVVGKCLDDYQGSTRVGAEVDLATCTGSARQNWTFEADGTLRIFGLCLTGNSRNLPLTLQTCTMAESQQWDPAAEYEFGAGLYGLGGGVLSGPGNVVARPELVRMTSAAAGPASYWHVW